MSPVIKSTVPNKA